MTPEVANLHMNFSGKMKNWFRVAKDDVSQYADTSISDKALVIGLSVLGFLGNNSPNPNGYEDFPTNIRATGWKRGSLFSFLSFQVTKRT